MRRSKSEIYLHFVWATHQRLPLITTAAEQIVYGCILKEAHKHGCEVLALGGVADHVHLLLKMPAKHSPSFLMQRIKGGSSTFARDHPASSGNFFGWQDGYGVFSVSRTHKKRVAEYVHNQKQHHADQAPGGRLLFRDGGFIPPALAPWALIKEINKWPTCF